MLPSNNVTFFWQGLCAGALAAGAGLLLFSAPLRAANISLEPSIAETGSWDSNPLMLTHNAKALWGSTTKPRLVITDETPTAKLSADLFVEENVFNQSNFDSTDFLGTFGVSAQSQRWAASLRQSTTYDTSRTSELTTFGRNTGVARHLGLSIDPSLSFSPDALNKYILDASAQTSRYDSSTLTDYNTFSVSPSWEHYFTPLHAGVFLIQAQRYQTASGPSLVADSIGPMMGWTAKLTPRLSFRALAGAQASRQKEEGLEAQDWQWNYVFTGNVLYKGQQDALDIMAKRAQQPYGNGTERLLTTFSVKETHDFNSKFSLDLFASYQFSSSSEQPEGTLESLLKAKSGITYHATEDVDISTSYMYKNEALTGGDEVAKGNIVTLGLVYRPWGERVVW